MFSLTLFVVQPFNGHIANTRNDLIVPAKDSRYFPVHIVFHQPYPRKIDRKPARKIHSIYEDDSPTYWAC